MYNINLILMNKNIRAAHMRGFCVPVTPYTFFRQASL